MKPLLFLIILTTSANVYCQTDSSNIYYNSGLNKANSDDPTGAIQDFNKAIELDSNNADAFYYRARITHLSSEFTVLNTEEVSKEIIIGKVGQSYNKAIEIDSNNADIYYYRGMSTTFILMSDKEKKIATRFRMVMEDLNKAIELDSTHADAYYLRGSIKGVLKDKEGACLDLEKSYKLGNADANRLFRENCNKK